MPPRQRLETRQREAAPMLQNQDVTTAAVILNNVLGPPLPRLVMNLVTPEDQPVPMGHDCTRCVATATCSLLNKATENEGNNPIMDRINAISLIKTEDPEFIQRATPEDRESLIRTKMMEIKEQRSNIIVEKPQIEAVAQEVEVKTTPIKKTPKMNGPDVEKTAPPKKERKKRQEKVETITLPKEVSVERHQDPIELHPANIPITIQTEKPIEKKLPIAQKIQDIEGQTSTVVSETRLENKPMEPVVTPSREHNKTIVFPHGLKERQVILDKIKRKIDAITTDIDKVGRSLFEMVFRKKSKLPPLITIPNVFVDKNQSPRSKKETIQFNVSKGEIFRYSPSPKIDKLDNGSKTLKKSIYIFNRSNNFNIINALPLEQRPLLQYPHSFSLVSLDLISLSRLYKSHDKSKSLENIKNKQAKKRRFQEKTEEKKLENAPKNIHDLLRNYLQEYILPNQTIKPERISQRKMEILIERIQQIISKEKKLPFAVIIISSYQESFGHKQKSSDQRQFDFEDNEIKYEVIPINQDEFLNIINLSTLMMDVMSLLSREKTPETEEEVFFVNSVRLLFAPEEIKKGMKSQKQNISMIIRYLVQVLQAINLLNIYLTSENQIARD